MTPKVRYTVPPDAEMDVTVYCTGSKCYDLNALENTGDGWECPNCGTFWDSERLRPSGAEWQFDADELDGLPLYDDDGDEVKKP